MDNENFLIKVKKSPNIKFDERNGLLQLPEAISFVVFIEEYEKELEEINNEYDRSYNKAVERRNKRSEEGWALKRLEENWNANNKLRDEKRKNALDELKKKYQSVNWVYTLVGERLFPQNLTHNNSFIKGYFGEKQINFPVVAEGGGLVYLEAFLPEYGAKGKPPFGIYVQAMGAPKISNILWTDLNDKIIEETTEVAWFSKVRLHIYTAGLYGQELDIVLLDRDSISNDDKLPFVDNKFKFQCEVNVYDATECDVKSGNKLSNLVDDDNTKKVPHVQKAVIDVWIDHSWKKIAGNSYSNNRLKIYPKINITASGKPLEVPNKFLNVHESGKKIDVEQDYSNKPAVIGKVETNIAMFHPCGYDLILAQESNNSKKITIFDRKAATTSSTIKTIGRIKKNVESNKKVNLIIETKGISTEECSLKNTENNHQKKLISIDNTILSENELHIQNKNSEISIDLVYTPNNHKPDEFVLSTITPIRKTITFNSCRINHSLNLEIYPDVYYLMGFQLATENPWYSKATKSYVKRKYLEKKKGFFTKEANKAVQKQRTKDYKEQQKAIREGYLNFSEFEYFLEYGYDDTMYEKVSFPEESPVGKILDSVMWVINTISELCFEKEAEEVEKEHNDERKEQVEKRKKKRKNYLGKKNKKLSKFPFKVEIGQPTFAGAVKWSLKKSEKEPEKIGTLYELKFLASPLISVKGSLDLLFVATKIPYLGAVVKGMTATADAVGTIDDFWNKIVDLFGGGDKHKIKIDVDYYLDLFVEGSIDIDVSMLTYHSIDGFGGKDFELKGNIEFGIECGANIETKVGDIYSEAAMEGEAKAVFEMTYDGSLLRVKYGGLYAVISADVKINDDNSNKVVKDSVEVSEQEKYLIHEGFSYEFKLNK
ncbi:hypothetical protein PG291_09610 [Riemerella anatipestifer]|nr:hypothetical protein [Riemerella anatipestifer]